jgi:hypothetical protein
MSRMTIALATLAGCLALAAGAVLGGFVPLPGLGSSQARPPCNALPSVGEVTTAIEEHTEVTSSLRDAVDGAQVSVARPCDGAHADRALVRVTVTDGDARDELTRWLGTHDAYGVPLEIEVS